MAIMLALNRAATQKIAQQNTILRGLIMHTKTLELSTIALISLALIFLGFASLNAGAADKKSWHLIDFNESDYKYLALSRERITKKTQLFFGTQFHGTPAHDIALLQRLLDGKKITANQRQLLQDMGVILADLMMSEFNLKWVIYHDQYGRSRALQLKHSESFFFPITMISRRAETGLAVDVETLYNKVGQKIDAYYQNQRYD